MKLKKGDLVKSDYYEDEQNVVRKIVSIKKNKNYGSGYVASADAGGICKCCKRPFANNILNVDSAWFKKVESQQT